MFLKVKTVKKTMQHQVVQLELSSSVKNARAVLKKITFKKHKNTKHTKHTISEFKEKYEPANQETCDTIETDHSNDIQDLFQLEIVEGEELYACNVCNEGFEKRGQT